MISKALASLRHRAGRIGPSGFSAVLGSVIALSTPAIALLLGWLLNCLVLAGSRGSDPEEASRFAALIPHVDRWLGSTWTTLSQVALLLGIGFALILGTAVLLFVFYRLNQACAVAFEVAMIEQLRQHAKRLATMRTLSAQQQALSDCLEYHLPRVRASLSRWWRTFPRHAVQLAACLLIAFLIQPMLAVLTLIATGLVALVYRFVDRLRRTALPVVRERAAQERATLVDLCLKGPLLASVHDEHELERRVSEQLTHYRSDAFRSLASSAWKTPILLVSLGGLACLFLFVIAVQVLRTEIGFTVAAGFTFFLCIVSGAISAVRIQRTLREVKTVENAAEELERFLAIPVPGTNGDDLKVIERVQSHAELDHVTLQDSRGRKLLEDVSAVFRQGQLIGVVASHNLQARALVELLMGFGRPVGGRMLVDGQLVTDLDPESLMRCAHWVAADGAVVTGSVRDNLLGNCTASSEMDVNDAIREARVYDAIAELPDGLATIISPGDDRLTADVPFRIGVARANLCGASVVVVEEPEERFDNEAEERTLEAIRSLVKHSSITVVLPQRLSTLRSCDVVLMLSDHKIADSGTHAELLQRNELYRHLNYLKFNPFRAGHA